LTIREWLKHSQKLADDIDKRRIIEGWKVTEDPQGISEMFLMETMMLSPNKLR
jgi:hypothetical protein